MWDAGPNYFAIFSGAEVSAGAFCAILGNALQEQFQQFGWSWNEINKNDILRIWLEEMRLHLLRKRRLGGKCIKDCIQKVMVKRSLYTSELTA